MPEKYMTSLARDTLSQRLERFDYSILACGRWTQWKPEQSHSNVLSSFKMVVIESGRCKVTAGGVEREVGRGDVLLFAPFVRNQVACLPGETVGLCYLYFDLLPIEKRTDFMCLFHCRILACFPGLIPERAFPELERTRQAVTDQQQGSYFAAKLMLYHTLLHVLRYGAGDEYAAAEERHTAEERVVSRCIEYLDAHMTENVRVSDLCAAVNVSQSYLCKSFVNTVGKGTKEFIVTYKLRHLEQELRSGSLSLRALAERYGFSSESALSEAFKKYYGIPPRSFRRPN